MFIVSAGSQSQQNINKFIMQRENNLNEGLLSLTGPRVALLYEKCWNLPRYLRMWLDYIAKKFFLGVKHSWLGQERGTVARAKTAGLYAR